MFNGKDLTGWIVVGDATWSVPEPGLLRVDGAGMTTRSELRSVEEFGDFELRLSVRPHKKEGGGGANSGVFFRGVGDKPWPRTYEAQGRLQRACGVREQMVALEPDDADAWQALAELYEQRGMEEQASAAWARVAELHE